MNEIRREDQNKPLANHFELNKKIENFYTFLKDHPAIIGTTIYFYFAGMGVLYNFFLFRQFQLNIFDFAEANDFLLAAFKEPLTIFYALLGIAFIPVALHLLYILPKPDYKSLSFRYRHPKTFIVSTIAISISFGIFSSFVVASWTSSRIKQKSSSFLEVHLKAENKSGGKTQLPDKLKIIGSTDKFDFFYDIDTKRAYAIPISEISFMVSDSK